MAAKKNNKAHILFRYGLITIGFVLFGVVILVKLFSTTVIEAHDWNDRARSELSRIDTIAPERGNILADNGNILACNLKVYDIKIDLRHDKIKRMKIVPWSSTLLRTHLTATIPVSPIYCHNPPIQLKNIHGTHA